MTHTARQLTWARAAREPGPDLARGLFALLAEPSESERAAGITTSPLDEAGPGAAVPAHPGPHRHKWDAVAGFNRLVGFRRCERCGEVQELRRGRWQPKEPPAC